MKKGIILLAAVLIVALFGCAAEGSKKFTVYVGLNDAETGTQLLSEDEAKQISRKIITDEGCGYTEYISYGAYVDNGNVIGNDTLIYVFFLTEREHVDNIASAIKSELKLASVLVEEDVSSCNFVN